ncbi:MAG: hypothetical protein HOM21_11350 [Halobacteriovoraceae bacterium]|jgi:shikimate kinase|nr:hypothetical protein [Halobacteriovoraceae bacterium]
MIFLLSGFMGSGKTTLFERLKNSPTPGVGFRDTDQEVLALHGAGFSDLGSYIESSGFSVFRAQERALLEQILLAEGDQLVSLGGGALDLEMAEKIAGLENCCAVWLDVPFEVCWQRVKEAGQRPLVKKGKEFLEQLYSERLPTYQKSRIRLHSDQIEAITELSQLKALAAK